MEKNEMMNKDIMTKANDSITICFDYLRKSSCYDMLKTNSEALYDALFFAKEWGIISKDEYTKHTARAKEMYNNKLQELS